MTFVELLMAATVFSVLLVGLSGHLRAGVTAWRRATTTVERLQQLRVALDRIGQDLAGAYLFDPSGAWQPQPLFATDRMEFYTVRRGPQVGAQQARVWFVSYRLEMSGGSATLVRTAQTIRDAVWTVPVSSQPLLDDVSLLAVRYAVATSPDAGQPGSPSQITWVSPWQDPMTLPNLVEVTVELADAPAVVPAARQAFAVATGTLSPSQGGTQGGT